jgi:hypothetical protein
MSLNFGLIGDGRIATRHRKAIDAIGCKLKRVYDPGKDSSCRILDHEFFDGLDWVAIASPTNCHYGHIKAALQYGMKVICEKPYVLPWEPVIDSDAVFVVMQLRWLDGLPETAKRIRIIASRNEAYFKSWKGDPLLTGGLFFDVFIHYVDLARRYGCELEAHVQSEGEQGRWIDEYNLLNVDMDQAYRSMYEDIVYRGVGVRPQDVARLHWMLGRYTERFGFGREIIGKQILVRPNGVVR